MHELHFKLRKLRLMRLITKNILSIHFLRPLKISNTMINHGNTVSNDLLRTGLTDHKFIFFKYVLIKIIDNYLEINIKQLIFKFSLCISANKI